MTRDIDIVLEVDTEDTERLFALFSNDFYADKESIKNAVYNLGMFNIIHRVGIVKVDFIVKKDTEYRKAEFERRRAIEFEGLGIDVVSPEDLILSKLDWARDSLSEMQIRDVKNLMRNVVGLDMPYIEKWVGKLNLRKVYGEAVK